MQKPKQEPKVKARAPMGPKYNEVVKAEMRPVIALDMEDQWVWRGEGREKSYLRLRTS